MKCQILFSGNDKKNVSICRLLKVLPRVLSIKAMIKSTLNNSKYFMYISRVERKTIVTQTYF